MSNSSNAAKRRKMKGSHHQYLHQFLRPENKKDIAIVKLRKIISAATSATSNAVLSASETEILNDGQQLTTIKKTLPLGGTAVPSSSSSTSLSPKDVQVNGIDKKESNNNEDGDDSGRLVDSSSCRSSDNPVKTMTTANEDSDDEGHFSFNSLTTTTTNTSAVEHYSNDEVETNSEEDSDDDEQMSWTDEEFSLIANSSVVLDETRPPSFNHNAPPGKSYKTCEDCTTTELIDETAKSIILSQQQQGEGKEDELVATEEEKDNNIKKRRQNSLPPPSESVTYENLIKQAIRVAGLLQKHSITNGFIAVAVKQEITLPSILIGIMDTGCSFYMLDYKKPVCDSYLARTVVQFNWIIADVEWIQSSDIEDELVLSHHVFNLGKRKYFLINFAEIPKDRVQSINYPRFKYAYAMRTTGTCGNRRIVLVPHKAIAINVTEFIKKFRMTSKDVVFGVAPPTFDPSIIDLFVTLGSGSKVVYVDDSIKLIPTEAAKAARQEKVTILQCTPSYLMRFDKEFLRSTLFHKESSLRILALGGEKCLNKSTLRKLIPKEKRPTLKLFNLYGHTELSCWASVERISLAKTGSDEVSLGNPLSYVDIAVFRLPTEFGFGSEGEVFIGSTKKRKCVVFSEKFGTILNPVALEGRKPNYRYLQTGDYVKVRNTYMDSKLKTEMYFVNRIDRIRKRNGIKVDLENIEKVALSVTSDVSDTNPTATKLFSSAECFEHKQRILLLLNLDKVYPDHAAAMKEVCFKLYSHLKSMLYFEDHPERILILPKDTPLNDNWKLDLKKIFEQIPPLHDETDRSITKYFFIDEPKFQEIFHNLWQSNTLSAKHPEDEESFLSCGGTSVSAVRLVEDFFFKIQRFGSELHITNEKLLINVLLGKPLKEVKSAFYEIVKQSRYPCQFSLIDSNVGSSKKDQYVEAPWEASHDVNSMRCKSMNEVARMKLPPSEYHRVQISVGLCVDATPVIAPHPVVRQICITGSHSGAVYAFSMLDGLEPFRSIAGRTSKSLVWKRLFPNRIECSIVIHPHPTKYLGYLGCHDGKLYMISTVTGATEWSVSCGSSIRCSPTISPKGDSVVVLTGFTVLCIDALHGTILWTQVWSSFIISKSPAITDTAVFFASKAAGMASLCIKTGALLWNSDQTFICTSPLVVPAKDDRKVDLVVFGDTKGRIFALDQSTGERIWKFRSSYGYKDPPSNLCYHDCCLNDGPSRGIIFTTLSGFLRSINATTGVLKYEIKTSERLCSVPLIVHVTDEPPPSSNKVICSAFFNSRKGGMYWAPLFLKKPAIKIYEYGGDGAESFSSPALIPQHNIIAVGSRDNKAYFVEFQKPHKSSSSTASS